MKARSLAAITVVTFAGFAVLGSAASATTASGTDPANDNGSGFNPRGDVVAFSISNSTTSITVSATTATFDNPATSNNWISGGSGILFSVDTTNDGNPEFIVVYQNGGSGRVIADVFNNNVAGTFLCNATPTFDAAAKSYSATFPASCINSPANVELSVLFGYLTPTTTSFDDTTFTKPASATSSTSTTTSTTSTSASTSSTTRPATTTSTTAPATTTSAPATTTSAPATTTSTSATTTSTTEPATTSTTAAAVAGEGTTSTSVAASAAAATTTTTVAGAGGNLPRTGAQTAFLLLLGLTFLGAGWAMVAQARRRRTAP